MVNSSRSHANFANCGCGNPNLWQEAINRQKSFNQDVVLTFGEMPTGVSIEPPTSVIKHDDKEAQFTLTAVDDAALGNFTIKLTGHPAKGSDASNELKLTVVKE